MNRLFIIVWIVFSIVFADQALKIWVKSNMMYGEEILIFGQEWARIHFVENNGMAFGLTLGGKYGKLTLSIYRLLAINLLFLYLFYMLEEKHSFIKVIGVTMILAGAIGNMIDTYFYGVFFSESTYAGEIAQFSTSGEGYSSLLHGKVVDMLYFPIWSGHYPDWHPRSGEYFLFFRPVSNIADMSVRGGVLIFSANTIRDVISQLIE